MFGLTDKILAIVAAIVLAGCTVVPAATALSACELLQTAASEADLEIGRAHV